MPPKPLARKDIAEMDFNRRLACGADRVAEGNRRMGEPARIDHDPLRRTAGLLHPIDQLAFVIGLPEIDRKTKAGGSFPAIRIDLGKRTAAIDGRLARTEEIEVRAVE